MTINEQARRALAERGIEAHLVRNAFDLDPLPGDRDSTRGAFGFAPTDVVILQPTRAIPRKEVGRGIRFAEEIAHHLPDRAVRFWITGPAEDGFGAELDRLVDVAHVPVTVGRAPRPEDAYAAAELVVFPSSWEGFGNPVIEATIAGRTVAVARYPVLEELEALGLRFISIDEPEIAAEAIGAPDRASVAANEVVLRDHFDLSDLPGRIDAIWAAIGWTDW